MKNKVILICIDGMRPDGFLGCGNPYAEELKKISAHSLTARSVFPSMTLPCHYSMAHSVSPGLHGILTNTYTPQVHPVDGIFEKAQACGLTSAFFYGWGPLRDIASPRSLTFATFINSKFKENTDALLTEAALKTIGEEKPDFAFLYQPDTDDCGHANGWMGEEYLKTMSMALDNVKKVMDAFGEEYHILLMADHGGHDRNHGTDLCEDMTIPLFFYGNKFQPGVIQKSISLLDIAPTIAKILGIAPDPEWEGESVF